jgi:inner membrane protein
VPWWAWLALGVALLVIELAVSTEFWLVMLGASALVVSAVLLVGIEPPAWLQWLTFAVLSALLAVSARPRLRDSLAQRAPGVEPQLVGERGTSREPIAPGALGSVELRGSTWRARNVGAQALRAGDPIRVERVEGLLLDVKG